MPIKIPTAAKIAPASVPAAADVPAEEAVADATAAVVQEEPSAPEKATAGAAKKALSKKAANGEATITVENKKTKVETTHTEKVEGGEVVSSDSELARVDVEFGYTMNLGDYNSARFSVRLSMPSDVDQIDTTFEGARMWAENRLTELVTAAKN